MLVWSQRGNGTSEGMHPSEVFFYLRQEDAEQLWRSLMTQDWKRLKEPA